MALKAAFLPPSSNMQSTIRAKAAWASIVKPNFTPEPLLTLSTISDWVNKDKKTITVPAEEVSEFCKM